MASEEEWVLWENRLFNKNWKVRSKANVDLASLCDSVSDPKDPRIREFGPFFTKTVADRTARVQEKALDVLISYLRAADADASRFGKEVCDAVLANCMTGRLKTLEKTQEVFMLWVELEAVDAFLDAMENAIKNKVSKEVVPAIDVMLQALSEFGSKVPKRILKMLPELFEHQDQNVRARSKGLTLELCRWIGKDSVKSILFEKMGETMKKELEAQIVNVSGTGKPSRKIRSEPDKEAEQEAVAETVGPDPSEEFVAPASNNMAPPRLRYCHQCRSHKDKGDDVLYCKNTIDGHPCELKFCSTCLLTHYRVDTKMIAESHKWCCPKCQGNCNCSICRGKCRKVQTADSTPAVLTPEDAMDFGVEEKFQKLKSDFECQRKELAETRRELGEIGRENEQKSRECQEAWNSLKELQNELKMCKSMHVGSLVKEKSKWFSSMRDLVRKLKIMKMKHIKLLEEAEAYKKYEADINEVGLIIKSKINEQLESHEDLKSKYIEGAKERKELYNKVLDLRGNIRVFCRCRPLNTEEIKAGATMALEFDSAKDGELTVMSNGAPRKTFKFDAVFGPQSEQTDIFEDTAQFATSVLDGLEIRQAGDGIHHIPGLIEAHVNNMSEVWEVLDTGSNARAVSSTNANEHSSRSHCIHCVMVKGENLLNGEHTRSKLWLVDLAGSERVAKTEVLGDILKQTQNINRSLSALGDVISTLATKSPHIPFRNSKLTHLLQDSLGGDSKALMFVQISPNENDRSVLMRMT
ncbi:hypothetical protein OROGR_014517 [Orobanche gracilis]